MRGIIKAEVCVICRNEPKAEADNTSRGLNLIIPHILREPNSIIVLFFICIYIGLRVNACIVNKNTQATKPFVFFRFWLKQHKLV